MADLVHRGPTAGTVGIFRGQSYLDPGQMHRKRTAAGPTFGDAIAFARGVAPLSLRLQLRDGCLDVAQSELQLFLGQLL